MISNNKKVLFQPSESTEPNQQGEVKVKIRKKTTKSKIVQTSWYVILIRLTAAAIKNQTIMQTIAQNIQKTGFSLCNFCASN